MEIQQDVKVNEIESALKNADLSELRVEKEKVWNYLSKLKIIIEMKEKLGRNESE